MSEPVKVYCENLTERFDDIVRLPVELLVYIVSFLPTARDKVKLRYVSRTLRVVSETPSLWSEFVWPLYDRREERSVINVLKACGDYTKRLVFPDHVPATSLIEMLSHCNNVTQLSIPPVTEIDSEELRLAVQHVKHLEQLEVQLSTDIKPLLQIDGLNELTVHVPKQYHSLCAPWVEEWMERRCMPCNLNLITETFDFSIEANFIELLLQWNFTPLIGYNSFLKLYYVFEMPLKLSHNLPVLQLEIGQTVILPFVSAGKFGIMDLDYDVLVLTDRACNGKQVCKVDNGVDGVLENSRYQNLVMNNLVASLDCVTEFNIMLNEDNVDTLEQVAVACPNLQRLKVRGFVNVMCILQGLRRIALNCPHFCGLNLSDIATVNDCHLEFWEVLSEMKLTHLFLETCVLFGCNSDKQKLVHLFQKFFNLQALQIQHLSDNICDSCMEAGFGSHWSLLSHFPALKYCRMTMKSPSVVLDVINSCKQVEIVTFLECWGGDDDMMNFSSVSTSSLQQLSVCESGTTIPDVFMETVSAHGGLVHVVLIVWSVSNVGITSLVKNSPKLLTCLIDTRQFITDDQDTIKNLKDNLQQKFPGRKLFTVGTFNVVKDRSLEQLCDCIPGTDFFPLWRYA